MPYMRTTIEFPDDLLAKAKTHAALSGTTLRELLIEAVQEKLNPRTKKTRRSPPEIGSEDAPIIRTLTAKDIDEALFG